MFNFGVVTVTPPVDMGDYIDAMIDGLTEPFGITIAAALGFLVIAIVVRAVRKNVKV